MYGTRASGYRKLQSTHNSDNPDIIVICKDVHLYIFCSRGTSLAVWKRAGILDRQLDFVESLGAGMKSVTLVSYGGPADRSLASAHPRVQLSTGVFELPRKLRALEIAHIVPRFWPRPALVMSWQVYGSRQARLAARLLQAPFIAYCGYLQSDFDSRAHGPQSRKARRAAALERESFGQADQVVVTTEAMRATVLGYGVAPNRVTVIPNYVDLDSFAPFGEAAPGERKVVFVGRFNAQKNLSALIDAVSGLDVTLELIGDGELRPLLVERARERGVRLSLPGIVPHERLPAMLAKATVFVLPSHYEGHPKVLIEAMAAGLPIVGAASMGISDMLSHERTGLIAEPSAEGLRAAISRLLSDRALAQRLGQEARATAINRYSKENAIAAFRAVYERVLAARRDGAIRQ
jgi:glycosyltransferase involved in cell wall biosynthesis